MIVSIFAILLNTLRIRGIDLGREEVEETGPLADIKLLVPNMVCEGCASKISTALSAVPGVHKVKSKVPRKHVYIQYEPNRVRTEQLKEAVSMAGFTAFEA
jgi:copper chaperone CopZ